jgi:aminopeptidase YwaD
VSKKTNLKTFWLLLVIILLSNSFLFSQDATLLPDSLISEIIHQVSGEKAWWHVHSLAQYHRIQPSAVYHQAALYVEEKAKDYGLEDVKIEKFVADGKTMNFTFRTRPAWDAEKGELWIIEPIKKKIADFDEIRVSLAVYSRDAQVTGELVDVGSGESPKDYEGKDVKGRMVLASGHPGAVQRLAVFEREALGVLSYYTIAWQRTRQPGDYPDQVTWGRIDPESDDGQQSTFAFMLSYRNGTMLKNLLDQGQKVVLKADIKARVYAGHYEVVTAIISGTKYPDQEFVFIAHLDHYRPGANDNASGSAVLLEIARSIQSMIAEKTINPPLRTIRFLWVPEINGTIPYLANHPEAFEKMAGVINMDMVGANQKEAKAIFVLTRTPYSLPTYFDDVIQNFTEYARDVNREPSGMDETLTIIAPTGTRDNFDVEIVDYGGGSDHYIFVDGAIRIPAVMFGTWPDVFYHSSEDKPDKVDPTTLKRAIFLGVSSAIYFAQATSEDVPRLAMEVMSKGKARIARDEKKAYDLLSGTKADELVVKYKEAKNIIHQAFVRESEAILSCSYFAEGNKDVLNYLQKTSDELLKEENSSLNRLKNYYSYLCKYAGINATVPELTVREKQFSKIIPKRVRNYRGPLDDDFLKLKFKKTFDEKQLLLYKEIPQDNPALGNVPFEILNFVDGKRSITDIRNAVSADYCPLSLDAVEEYLKVLEKAGVVR